MGLFLHSGRHGGPHLQADHTTLPISTPPLTDKPHVSPLTAPKPHTRARHARPHQPQPLRIETLTPGGWAEWDRFVHHAAGGTLFHTTAWMGAVHEAFGHTPIYLLARRGADMVAGLPLFDVRSLLGGRLLVSVPYAIYGGPLGADPEALRLLQDEARDLAERIQARAIDLRCQRAAWAGVPVIDRYVTFRRPLPDHPADCLHALPRKARAAARSARQRHGLRVDVDDRHLQTVWRLYCTGMHRLASLNYPASFFRELIERTPGGHIVSLVSHRGRPVAGLVTFLFNGVAMPYFVGADQRCRRLNLYNFIYLTAMERAVDLGCHTFDFGRSRRDNRGACAFKKNQGFPPERLEYQLYTPPGRQAPDLTPANPKFALARRLWPALPQILTRPLGAWISRHVPG